MARKMPAEDREVQEQVRDLDGILPGSIDRRQFFKASIASAIGFSLTGCLNSGGQEETTTASTDSNSGSDGSDTDGSDGSDTDDTVSATKDSLTFRNGYKDEPDYSVSYVAQLNGHWDEDNMNPAPKSIAGNGSADTAKRIGTGREYLGMGATDPQITGLAQGYDLRIIGGAKTRSSLALLYPKGEVDPDNLEGSTILAESALDQNTLPLYLEAKGLTIDDVTTKTASAATQYALLAQGDGDAIWGQVDNLPAAQSALPDDITLDADALYKYRPALGYTTMVNGKFLEEGNNLEYVSKVLEGYSHATGWVMLNPKKAVKLMREEVNTSLKTGDIEGQVEVVRIALIASNLYDVAKNNGLLALSEEQIQQSFTGIADSYDLETTPTLEDGADFRPQEMADMRQFSSDEWNQAVENAGEYVQYFE